MRVRIILNIMSPVQAEITDLYQHINEEDRVKIYLQVADKHPTYQFSLALWYFDGDYLFPKDYDKGMYWITRYMKSLCGWHGMFTVLDAYREAQAEGREMTKDNNILFYATGLLIRESLLERDFYYGITIGTESHLGFGEDYEIKKIKELSRVQDTFSVEDLKKAYILAKDIKSYWKVENRYADVYEDEECIESRSIKRSLYRDYVRDYIEQKSN